MTRRVRPLRRVRDWLPAPAVATARGFVFSTKSLILRSIAWSRTLCAVYYLLSPAFRREQQAVVAGQLRQLRRRDRQADLYLLRRNTHRLEKGLLMRPRRPLYALDYIAETLEAYSRCHQVAGCDTDEDLRWSRDVLAEYFSVVTGDHPVLLRARQRFAEGGPPPVRRGCIPFRRADAAVPVCYESLLALARRRRSVRWFDPRPVPRELLDKAVVVAQQAPSSCNRQPYRYRFFDEPSRVQELAGLPMGTAGFAHNIPVLGVVVGDLSAFFGERDRHGIYVDGSLSVMAFMLALETLGLSSCPLNWPDVEARERRAEKALGLAKHERIILFMAIGFPDPAGLIAFSQKKPLGQARAFDG